MSPAYDRTAGTESVVVVLTSREADWVVDHCAWVADGEYALGDAIVWCLRLARCAERRHAAPPIFDDPDGLTAAVRAAIDTAAAARDAADVAAERAEALYRDALEIAYLSRRVAEYEADAEMAWYQQLEAIDRAMNRGPDPRWTGEANELLAALATELDVEPGDLSATWIGVREALPEGFGSTVDALAAASLRAAHPGGQR